jgi:hypothetical protein
MNWGYADRDADPDQPNTEAQMALYLHVLGQAEVRALFL